MSQAPSDPQTALASLNEGQREALRLVFLHMSSKDIGRELNVSSHTIDNRVKAAMQKLGAANRWEAARLLAESEGAVGYETDYRRLVDQSPVVDDNGDPPPVFLPAGHGDRPGREGAHEGNLHHSNLHDAATVMAPELGRWSASQVFPVPAQRGEPNRMSPPTRIMWVLLIAAGGMIAFGALVSAVQSLGQLL